MQVVNEYESRGFYKGAGISAKKGDRLSAPKDSALDKVLASNRVFTLVRSTVSGGVTPAEVAALETRVQAALESADTKIRELTAANEALTMENAGLRDQIDTANAEIETLRQAAAALPEPEGTGKRGSGRRRKAAEAESGEATGT